MLNTNLRSSLAALPFALLSLVACTIAVNEDYGHGPAHGHDGSDHTAECNHDYEHCVDDADDAGEIDECTELKDLCLYGHVDRDEEPEDLTEVCIDLQIECLEEAEDGADVEACEALFDHCVAPQECVGDCAQSCSAPSLSGCLGSYVGCAGAAGSADEIEQCGDKLEQCTETLGEVECLPGGDSELLDICLTEHSLCISIGLGGSSDHEKACSAALAACTGAK